MRFLSGPKQQMTSRKPSGEPVWERERAFHDAIARDLDLSALTPHAIADALDRALLELAGDVRGRTILDAGCGQGDLTLHLLRQGATVTALDVSPGMVDVVRRRVEQVGSPGTELEFAL